MNEQRRINRPMLIFSLLGVGVAGVTLAAVIYGAISGSRVTCEVCVSYRGRTSCREASGPTASEAQRTATDNACSFLAQGMTAVVECTTRTTPDRVTCSE